MSDLISRKAIIDKINERQRKMIYCFGFENDAVKIMDIAKSIIIATPSAQPEIIRCKECTYFDKYIDCKEMYQWDGFCADWARKTYENWYCSRAERRNDG